MRKIVLTLTRHTLASMQVGHIGVAVGVVGMGHWGCASLSERKCSVEEAAARLPNAPSLTWNFWKAFFRLKKKGGT